MRAEHDYTDEFVDFTISDATSRLGLLPRKALAKDVGVDEGGDGFSALVLTHLAASRLMSTPFRPPRPPPAAG